MPNGRAELHIEIARLTAELAGERDMRKRSERNCNNYAMERDAALLSALGRAAEAERMRAAVNVRPEVLAFARAMEERLRANDHKGGWTTAKRGYLVKRLEEEAYELSRSLVDSWIYLDAGEQTAEHRAAVLHEAADVANFAMMIADVSNSLDVTSALAALASAPCGECGGRGKFNISCKEGGCEHDHFGSCRACSGTGKAPAPASALCATCGGREGFDGMTARAVQDKGNRAFPAVPTDAPDEEDPDDE